LGIYLTVFLWQPLYAHGGGFPQLNSVEVGPYFVSAWTQPTPWRVGEPLHLTLAVTQRQANGVETPVPDANIVVRFRPIEQAGEGFMRSALLSDAPGAAFYEADVELPAAGDWQTNVEISSSAGVESVQFTITVLPAQGIRWGWMIAANVAIILLIISGIVLRRQPSTVKKK
jgi:hypothetical protein